MKHRTPLFFVFFLLLLSPGYAQAAATVQNLRLWQAPDHTRLVFDLSAPTSHQVHVLTNPHRLLVVLKDSVLLGGLPQLVYTGPFLRGARAGRRADRSLHIVLDLKRAVRPRTFLLRPNAVYGYRLVIDLYAARSKAVPVVRRAARPRPQSRTLVVAVDAGHGGEDKGAQGRRRTFEKDATLAIAKKVKRILDGEKGLRGVLTRRGDYYISLRRRTAIARKHRADLFVSIHADAFPKRSVRGSSVYALSQRGASSETARWLANKENAADLIGGVSLNDKEDLVAQVLLDLSMTKTIEDSLILGADVLSALSRVGPVHIKKVEQAGFAVLKSPDIPSVLIETAFISNPKEERLLRDSRHQHKIARAIVDGIRRYARRSPARIPTTVARSRSHTVRRGDTLSTIARRYQVSLGSLRRANELKSSLIRVGDKLMIPSSSGS